MGANAISIVNNENDTIKYKKVQFHYYKINQERWFEQKAFKVEPPKTYLEIEKSSNFQKIREEHLEFTKGLNEENQMILVINYIKE